MSFLRSRRGLAFVVVVVLLGLLLIRPGVERLRGRIAGSISSAIGRPVDIGAVSVHLLPQPGFDLSNFVVHDDPSFSAEPMVRSDDVTAALRVSSLFRGRLEIARLSLTEPSVNLARDSSGRWNLENLLERAARTPVAPTGKSTNETRPAFPYIEADHGRINFKFGPEKKPYALTDADFSFWQASENTWGMRLKAQPIRTDFNLSDTGLLRVDGTWRRAPTLHQTPLQFSMQWDRAQLGQLTKLILGDDKGWRGSVTLSATLNGTPADLGVHTEASVDDFRRYDILSGGSLRLAAKCDSRYSSADRQFSDILCGAPVGTGELSLNGTLGMAPGSFSYRMALSAQDVPAQALAALLRRTKSDIPEDMIAAGMLDGLVRFQRSPDGFAWSGGGQLLGLSVESQTAKTQLAVDSIPFTLSSSTSSVVSPRRTRSPRKAVLPALPENHLDIGPFELPLGKPNPVLVQGWIARSGYDLRIGGDAQLQRLLQLARLAGLPVPRPAADGSARLDLQLAGAWSGFAAPRATGRAQLQGVRAEVRGINAPLEIAAASVVLSWDQVTVQSLAATIADTSWHGSLTLPRPCPIPGPCFVHFDLHTNKLATDQLNRLLNPAVRKRPWYRFLTPSSQAGLPFLVRVHAAGTLSADRVSVHNLVATKVSADITLEDGKLTASNLRGDVLGGKHVGEWKANFLAKPPDYAGSGKLDKFALSQLSEAMHDGWITGTATAGYQAKTSGLSAAELFSSADATLDVEAHDGVLPHIELKDPSGPLRIRHLAATLILHNNTFEVRDGKLETPGGPYQLSGTASLKQTLDLKLIRSGAPSFSITGTLTRPRVALATTKETEAVLKP